MLERLSEWFPEWMQSPTFVGVAGTLSIATLVGSALLLPWLAGRLPADYFIREEHHGPFHDQHPALAFLGRMAKNLLGVLLLLAGFAMLVTPGQGLLTIVAGVLLLDFPNKRKVELALVRRPSVARAMNWLRSRRGAPPLLLDEVDERVPGTTRDAGPDEPR